MRFCVSIIIGCIVFSLATPVTHALSKKGVDQLTRLPTIRFERPKRDEKFAQHFLRLPKAFDFYGDILKRDAERIKAKSGRQR